MTMLKLSLIFFSSFLLVSPSVLAFNPLRNSHQTINNEERLITQRTVNLTREKAEQLLQEIQVLINNEEWELALDKAKQMTELVPDTYVGWYLLGVIYIQLDQVDSAINSLETAKSLDADNEDILFALGKVYHYRGLLNYEQNNLTAALFDLNKAIDIDPNLVDAYNIRGDIYLKQSQWQLALSDFNKVLEIAPKNSTAYMGRSVVYFELKQDEKGIKDLKKAASLFLEQNDRANYEKVMDFLRAFGQ